MIKKITSIVSIALLTIGFSQKTAAQNALRFDGSGDYITTDYAGIMGTSPRTIEAWVRSYSGSNEQVIVAYGDETTNGGRFTFRLKNVGSTDVVRIEIKGSGIDGSINVGDSVWHHVAVTYDPNATNNYKLYVDGVLDNEGNMSTSINTNPGVNIQVGKRVSPSLAGYFDGEIDEVRIWDVAKSVTDLNASMNSELCGVTPNLAFYLKFNEGVAGGNNTSVTSFNDYSGNSYVATLNGFTLSGNNSNWVAGKTLTVPTGVTAAVNDTMCKGTVYNFGLQNITAPGTYTEVFTTSVGCDSTVTLTLAEDSVNALVVNDGYDLKAVTTNVTYQWYKCSPWFKLNGETNQIYSPTDKNYYAVVVNNGNCQDTSICISNEFVSIDETTFETLKVYPNPTNNTVNVDLGQNVQNVEINVLSLNGQVIYSHSFNAVSKHSFNLDCATGVYLLEVKSDSKYSVLKLIKE